MKIKAASSQLGRFVRARREELGLTQAELAARAPGLTRSTVTAIEVQPERRTTSHIMSALAKALNVSIEELYRGAGLQPVSQGEDEQEETWEELYERAKLRAPRAVPLYAVFPSGRDVMPIGRIYQDGHRSKAHRIEAYLLQDSAPDGLALDGFAPAAIVDWDERVSIGDWVLCTHQKKLRCGRVNVIAGEPWVQTSGGPIRLAECQHPAKIEEFVLRREQVGR
jgi:DNA-binding XRE family transcriptional regulator